MLRRLNLISILVDDYDSAIRYYCDVLGFVLKEDTSLSETKRWVVVLPSAGDGCGLLLAKAASDEQRSRIGNQTGGRVFLFLHTDDFRRDYDMYRSRGVEFIREPVQEAYGMVSVFQDRYGNLWDLIQPNQEHSV